MAANLIVDGDNGNFNDSSNPAGDPPSDWGITKDVYSGGSPNNLGGSFTRETGSSPAPFEGTASADANYSGGGGTLAGLVKAWSFDTAISVEANQDYIIEGYYAFIGGSTNFNDNLRPFLYPEELSLSDMQIISSVGSDLTAQEWNKFTVFFNTAGNTSLNLNLGGEMLNDVGSGGNTFHFDKLSLSGPVLELTQRKKKICVLDACTNPFYVKWLNSLGGWSYWMFEYNQEITTSVERGDNVGTRVVDFENTEQFTRSLGNSLRDEWKVRVSGINDNEFEALKEIGASKQVYRMFQDNTQIGLKVKRMFATRRTKDVGHIIEFTFTVPKKLFQTE